MKTISLNLWKLLLPLVAANLLSGCTGSGEQNIDAPTEIDTQVVQELEETTFSNNASIYLAYQNLPSPDEIFAFLDEGKNLFSAATMLPPSEIKKVDNFHQKAFLFGFYSADLAYSVAFQQYQSSIEYFANVRDLGEQLGLGNIFDSKLVERIQSNLNSIDSLQKISNISYFNVIDHLLDANHGKLLVEITLGGWIEALHLLTELAQDPNAGPVIVQRLADQKYALENLLALMKQFNDDARIAELEVQIEELNKFFSGLSYIEGVASDKTIADGAKTIIGRGQKLTMSTEQLIEVKTLVDKIRLSILNG